MEEARKVNVSDLIDNRGIGRFQISLFALCATSLVMDGFDVQAMGYVAPEVIRELGMSGGDLGSLIGAANLGLLLGSLLFTVLADKVGRRPVLIFGTFFYALMSLLTARATTPEALLWLRFVGGLGLGSVLPNASALIGEYSPKAKRITLIMTITLGFTAGAALGGFVAAALMPAFGWRSVFYFGGLVPLAVGVLMIFWLPESLQFLAVRGKFRKLGEWLKRIDPSVPVDAGTEYVIAEPSKGGVPVVHLLAGGRAPVTLLYWLVNFTNLVNLYFLAGLLPTILTAHGYSSSTSATIVALMQAGGLVGTFGLAWLIAKKGFTPMLAATFAVAAVSIGVIGNELVLAVPALLTAVVILAGWCVVGGQPGLNALGATYYPTYMRSTGVGWGLGIGRVGGIVGPYVGGQLLDLDMSTQQLFLVFALPAVISMLAMLSLHLLFRAPGAGLLRVGEGAA
jgi:AAHS family 4-hydroxybenzoate transporter-like MFS transporter